MLNCLRLKNDDVIIKIHFEMSNFTHFSTLNMVGILSVHYNH
jgi:hypothetical protein